MSWLKCKGNLLNLFSIFLGLISIVYSIAMKAYRATFSIFFSFVGIGLIIFGFLMYYIKGKKFGSKMKFLIKFIKVVIISVMIIFVVLEGLIVYNGSKSDDVRGDYVLVLGAGLWGDTPSLTLRQRLDTSLEYVKKYPNVKMILSGGKGPGETITESEGMKRYLIKNGMDEKRIILEDKSTNTMENFQYTKELLKNIDGRENLSIVIVTSDFHMFRSKTLAKINGFRPYGYPSSTHPGLIVAYHVRECMAIIKFFIFDFI